MPHDEEQFDTLPETIVDALRGLDGPAVLPDAERDADVLSGARLHLATRPPNRKRRNLKLFIGGSVGGGLAAAAMLGVAFILSDPNADEGLPMADLAEQNTLPTLAEEAPNSQSLTAARGDIDGSGSIDILDAYALARRLEQGQAGELDLNNDGQTNQRDIDWIANQVVALNSGEQG